MRFLHNIKKELPTSSSIEGIYFLSHGKFNALRKYLKLFEDESVVLQQESDHRRERGNGSVSFIK